MVDYSSLENCRTERCRGFESLSLRKKPCKHVFAGLFSYLYANNTRALRIIFPEKPVNPALIRITNCNQTGCECIVGASNPSLMKGWVLS